MEIGSSQIRQRKGITKIVKDLDIFEKVVDNIKEERKVSSGAISFVVFVVIFVLFCTETYTYAFNRKHDYQFTVDTDMDEMPLLDLDMVIATPCSSLQVASTSDEANSVNGELLRQSIQKNPTRFEFTDEEQMYWTVLRHAHAHYNQKGIRALEELEYVDDDIETNLENIANEKQKNEAMEIKKHHLQNKDKKPKGSGQIMFLVSNGMGMFQLVADTGSDETEGQACRLHGKFRVRKGREEKIVMSISNPMMIFNHQETPSGNISHRIEKFNFGPRIPGLVTPLAGAEHISISGQDIYRYFLKIVPTKIHGYFGSTTSYQYSVTFLKKKLKDGEHSHGGISIEYEFAANVIEVHRSTISFVQYFIRICSILGGVYATSSILNNIVQMILEFVYQKNLEKVQYPHRHLDQHKNDFQADNKTHFVMDANVTVH